MGLNKIFVFKFFLGFFLVATSSIRGLAQENCDCEDEVGQTFEITESPFAHAMEILVLQKVAKDLGLKVSLKSVQKIIGLYQGGEFDLNTISSIFLIIVDDNSLDEGKKVISTNEILRFDQLLEKILLGLDLSKIPKAKGVYSEIHKFLSHLDSITLEKTSELNKDRLEMSFQMKNKEPYVFISTNPADPQKAKTFKVEMVNNSKMTLYRSQDSSFLNKLNSFSKGEHKQRILGMSVKGGQIAGIPFDGSYVNKRIMVLEKKLETYDQDDMALSEKDIRKKERIIGTLSHYYDLRRKIDDQIIEGMRGDLIQYTTHMEKMGKRQGIDQTELEKMMDESQEMTFIELKGVKLRMSSGINLKGLKNLSIPVQTQVLVNENPNGEMSSFAQVSLGGGILTDVEFKSLPEDLEEEYGLGSIGTFLK